MMIYSAHHHTIQCSALWWLVLVPSLLWHIFFFRTIGFVSPICRSSFMTTLMVIYILSVNFTGCVSGNMYKIFQGKSWQLCTLLPVTLSSGLCFTLFLTFNITLVFFCSLYHPWIKKITKKDEKLLKIETW